MPRLRIFCRENVENDVCALWWAGLAQQWAGKTILGPGLYMTGASGVCFLAIRDRSKKPNRCVQNPGITKKMREGGILYTKRGH